MGANELFLKEYLLDRCLRARREKKLEFPLSSFFLDENNMKRISFMKKVKAYDILAKTLTKFAQKLST